MVGLRAGVGDLRVVHSRTRTRSDPHALFPQASARIPPDDGAVLDHAAEHGQPVDAPPPASDRKSVAEGKRVYVCVDIGGGRITKKQKQERQHVNSQASIYNAART